MRGLVRARRGRRHGDGRVHRTEPRGLVEVRTRRNRRSSARFDHSLRRPVEIGRPLRDRVQLLRRAPAPRGDVASTPWTLADTRPRAPPRVSPRRRPIVAPYTSDAPTCVVRSQQPRRRDRPDTGAGATRTVPVGPACRAGPPSPCRSAVAPSRARAVRTGDARSGRGRLRDAVGRAARATPTRDGAAERRTGPVSSPRITKWPVRPLQWLSARMLPQHRDLRPQMTHTLEALRAELEDTIPT